MKKMCILFVLSLLLVSLGYGDNNYTINGKIADEKNNGKMIYLQDHNLGRYIDSTKVLDGKFVFTGIYKTPTVFVISIPKSRYYAEVLTENIDVTVELVHAGPPIVSSNGLNGEFGKINQQINILMNRLRGVVADSLSKVYTDKAELEKEIKRRGMLEMKVLYQNIMEANKDNILGVYCAQSAIVLGDMSFQQIDSLFNELPLARDYAPLMRAYDRIRVAEQSRGKPFVDFSGKNIDGTPAKLSDYVGKGKYVLVDFWASWCGPCTAEIPNLKYIHDNYPEVIVLGVNVWDKEDKFHKYIKDKDIQWSMLYASDDRTATDLYEVKGVPTIILFDPQGLIVDRTLRGEATKKKIAEIFKK